MFILVCSTELSRLIGGSVQGSPEEAGGRVEAFNRELSGIWWERRFGLPGSGWWRVSYGTRTCPLFLRGSPSKPFSHTVGVPVLHPFLMGSRHTPSGVYYRRGHRKVFFIYCFCFGWAGN